MHSQVPDMHLSRVSFDDVLERALGIGGIGMCILPTLLDYSFLRNSTNYELVVNVVLFRVMEVTSS